MDSSAFASPLSQPTVICGVLSTATPTASQRWADGTDANHRHVLGMSGINYQLYAGGSYTAGAPYVTSPRVVTAVFDGTASRLRVNGVPWAAGNAGAGTWTALRLGADQSGTDVLNLTGDVLWLCAYNRGTVLTAGELAALESGLASLYGLDASGRVDTFTAGGQACQIAVPPGYSAAAGAPLCVYHHGVSENQTAPLAEAIKAAVIQALIDAGYLVASSAASGDNWGNQASLDAMAALRAYCVGHYAVTRAVILAQSMGGVSGLLTLAAAPSNYKGFCGIYPAANLSAVYGGGLFASQIDAAYGINGTPYAAATAGHDPVLLSADPFGGLRYRWYASPDDTTITKAANTDEMSALVAAASVAPLENVIVTCSGVHGDPSHFRPADVVSFFGRCV